MPGVRRRSDPVAAVAIALVLVTLPNWRNRFNLVFCQAVSQPTTHSIPDRAGRFMIIVPITTRDHWWRRRHGSRVSWDRHWPLTVRPNICLLYTSDAADE